MTPEPPPSLRAGGEAIQLTSDSTGEFSPVWSPDGTLIAFHRLVAGQRSLFTVSADGTGRRGVSRLSARDSLQELFRAPSAVAAYVGGALQLFVVSTVLAWLPSYLNRFHGLAGDKACLKAAIVIVVSSIGIVLWGYVADRLAVRRARTGCSCRRYA